MSTKALYGESPAMIARRVGTSVGALIAANPQKPTMVVAGRRTFQGLRQGETLNTPGVGVGAPWGLGAAMPEIQQGSSGAAVTTWQGIIGVTADGQFGPQTKAATQAYQTAHGLSPDGIVGPLTWAAAGYSSGGGGSVPAPVLPSIPPGIVPPSAGVTVAAAAAAAALVADPSYCTSVRRSGTPVNTAVHNFKAAWNAANPGNPVPINTGNYEASVSSALSSALGGAPVPPGCGAAPPPPPPPNRPSPPPPPPPPPSGGGGGGTTPGGTTSPITTTTTGLSTGAMVAGAVGIVALVGLVALGVSGKSGGRGARGSRGSRGKPAHRKPKHHKKKHH